MSTLSRSLPRVSLVSMYSALKSPVLAHSKSAPPRALPIIALMFRSSPLPKTYLDKKESEQGEKNSVPKNWSHPFALSMVWLAVSILSLLLTVTGRKLTKLQGTQWYHPLLHQLDQHFHYLSEEGVSNIWWSTCNPKQDQSRQCWAACIWRWKHLRGKSQEDIQGPAPVRLVNQYSYELGRLSRVFIWTLMFECSIHMNLDVSVEYSYELGCLSRVFIWTWMFEKSIHMNLDVWVFICMNRNRNLCVIVETKLEPSKLLHKVNFAQKVDMW